MFHPISAVVARDNQPHWIAIQQRKVGTVHLPRQHDFAVERVVDIKCLDEIRRITYGRRVEAIECDLHRTCFHTRLFQHLAQRNAGPARITHGTVRELAAVDARRKVAPAVTGTLVDGDQVDRISHLLEVGKRQVERCVDVAADAQPIAQRIDRRGNAAPVIAYEECVVGRDHPFIEYAEWGFQLWRAGSEHDQRTLLRICDEITLTIFERQCDVTGFSSKCCQYCTAECACSAQGASLPKKFEKGAPLQCTRCQHQSRLHHVGLRYGYSISQRTLPLPSIAKISISALCDL